MKKVLFAVAAIAACVSANAQWTISGQFSFENTVNNTFDTSDGEIGDKECTSKRSDFYIVPSIGYVAGDWEFGVGASFGLGKQSEGNEGKGNRFGGNVYARRYFDLTEKIYLFAELNVWGNVQTEKPEAVDAKYSYKTLRAGLYPGIGYQFNEHWSIDAYIDAAIVEYGFRKQIDEEDGEVDDARSLSYFSVYADGFSAPVSFAISYTF